ncbi:uncharacterized protein LOC132657667 [Ovis aries]|uniref:uncharacterized protein LOC132657667 n=1 Tax=Ovis aries TaxID=9940 RepID=UPI0029526E77|nr:uncharacterized protein LOC132657667 [Ovis aries]XP_060253870.1 uncharacterized protein LOC132657667 [Ovis aries]XP_060253871.1 uncharacterized protein LOC132657667 [Ovis aries]
MGAACCPQPMSSICAVPPQLSLGWAVPHPHPQSHGQQALTEPSSGCAPGPRSRDPGPICCLPGICGAPGTCQRCTDSRPCLQRRMMTPVHPHGGSREERVDGEGGVWGRPRAEGAGRAEAGEGFEGARAGPQVRGYPWRVGQAQACPSGRGAWDGDQKQGGLAREERRERPRGPLLLGWGELSRARELGMGDTLGPGCLQPSAPHSGAQSPAVSNSSVAAVACGPCVQEGPLPPMSWFPHGLPVGSGLPGASGASFCLPGAPDVWGADPWVATRPRESWLSLTLRAAPALQSLWVPGGPHQRTSAPCSSKVASHWGCRDLCV